MRIGEYIQIQDIEVYFYHSLDCNIHFIIPAAMVASITLVLMIIRRRERLIPIMSGRSLGLLGLLFFVIWLIDIPAVFGRCPDPGPTLEFESYDPLGLLFGVTAGLLIFLTPCGLPPLPAYLSYFLGAKASKERGLGLGFLATSGFVSAISVVGIVVLLSRSFLTLTIAEFSPRAQGDPTPAIVVFPETIETIEFFAGTLAVLMGILMLLQVRIPFIRPVVIKSTDRSLRSVFLFSLGWGTASISCAPYAFLPVLLYAVATGGLEPFLGFALGMALPVLAVSTLLSADRGGAVKRLTRYGPRLSRYGGVIILGMGVYIMQYTFATAAEVLIFIP